MLTNTYSCFVDWYDGGKLSEERERYRGAAGWAEIDGHDGLLAECKFKEQRTAPFVTFTQRRYLLDLLHQKGVIA